MSDTFIPVDELEWKTVKIHKISEEGPEENHEWRYELELFEPLASWDVWAVWERERIDSMQQHIKQGDVVFDVGAEQGWMSALIAKYMSDEIVLVEPTAEFWPGIKAIWQQNGLKEPCASWCGFFSDENTGDGTRSYGFPSEAREADVIEKRKYRNVYDSGDQKVIPSIMFDQFVKDVNQFWNGDLKPDHITIDVEGAELLVLRGAEQTLRKHKPLVWCSVHPDMMERDYQHTKADLLFFMDECGYEAELLAIDHEEHWFFTPKK